MLSMPKLMLGVILYDGRGLVNSKLSPSECMYNARPSCVNLH